MIVVRKFLATFLWWIVFIALFILGLTAYILLQADLTGNPQIVEENLTAMTQELAPRTYPFMIFGTLAVAFLGSLFGILPLSKHSRN